MEKQQVYCDQSKLVLEEPSCLQEKTLLGKNTS